jgi:hypothetical protein
MQKDEKAKDGLASLMAEAIKTETQKGIPGYMTASAPLHKTGPFYADTHLIAARIKKALDPKNVANTSRFIDVNKIDPKEL